MTVWSPFLTGNHGGSCHPRYYTGGAQKLVIMKKKLELKKETVVLLDHSAQSKVRGGAMMKYVCDICGEVYENLPPEYCDVCSHMSDSISPLND